MKKCEIQKRWVKKLKLKGRGKHNGWEHDFKQMNKNVKFKKGWIKKGN